MRLERFFGQILWIKKKTQQLETTDHLFLQKIIVSRVIPHAQLEMCEIIILFFPYVLYIYSSVYHLMVQCVHTANTLYAPPACQPPAPRHCRARGTPTGKLPAPGWSANSFPSRNPGAAGMEFRGSQKVTAGWPAGSKKSPASWFELSVTKKGRWGQRILKWTSELGHQNWYAPGKKPPRSERKVRRIPSLFRLTGLPGQNQTRACHSWYRVTDKAMPSWKINELIEFGIRWQRTGTKLCFAGFQNGSGTIGPNFPPN